MFEAYSDYMKKENLTGRLTKTALGGRLSRKVKYLVNAKKEKDRAWLNVKLKDSVQKGKERLTPKGSNQGLGL